jgi:DNA-binding MarR family transcriptional regulator
VRTAPDPTDGRKSLVQITAAGSRLFESAVASRDAWLAHAIEQNVPAAERAVLERAIVLLERLASADRSRSSAAE